MPQAPLHDYKKVSQLHQIDCSGEEKKLAAVHEGLWVEPLVSVCKLVEKEIVIFVESSSRWQIAAILCILTVKLLIIIKV